MAVKIFLHGLESSNQGTKGRFFQERYPDMIIPNFTGPLVERMEKLKGVLSDEKGITLVGSSFGGLMAAMFALENEPQVDRLILLAPAINLLSSMNYKGKNISVPAWVFHGRNDAVIPLGQVEAMARKLFSGLSFHVVDDDHFLHKTFKSLDWDTLLA
ncbi:MAG: alpha/beta hydrolase [Deltaproteobacteria bacterium]